MANKKRRSLTIPNQTFVSFQAKRGEKFRCECQRNSLFFVSWWKKNITHTYTHTPNQKSRHKRLLLNVVLSLRCLNIKLRTFPQHSYFYKYIYILFIPIGNLEVQNNNNNFVHLFLFLFFVLSWSLPSLSLMLLWQLAIQTIP